MLTKDEIKGWLERGAKDGATHCLVVVDTFDYDHYPVYVAKWESASSKVSEYNRKSMQRVMEVYNLSMDFDKQLNEHRAHNL